MSDYPTGLPGEIVARFGHAFDVDDRLFRAVDAIAPIDGHDVLLLHGSGDGQPARRVTARGGRVTTTGEPRAAPPRSADIVIGLWPLSPPAPGSADGDLALIRLARPGGQVILIDDYGRDDVGALTPATMTPSGPSPTQERLERPFIERGWKVRVIHCFWTFRSLDEARAFVSAFGERGRTMAGDLTRPRLAHNLALIHRTVPPSP